MSIYINKFREISRRPFFARKKIIKEIIPLSRQKPAEISLAHVYDMRERSK